MRYFYSCLILLSSFSSSYSQSTENELAAFVFFDREGTEIVYQDVLEVASEADVFLFGELHNDAIIHWIQHRLVKDLSHKREITLGAEFFETDDQLALQEYMKGLLPEKNLNDEIHLWPNYHTDYAPIVKLAKDSGITFVATNVPRRYAGLVSKQGLDTLRNLSPKAKELLPELPIPFSMDTPGYSEMLEMMGGHMGGMDMSKFVQAQALKDATMATNILRYRSKGVPFIHFNGDFHSANYGGIYWYLKEYEPKVEVRTLKVYSVENLIFNAEEHDGGDIILLVASDFTKTH